MRRIARKKPNNKIAKKRSKEDIKINCNLLEKIGEEKLNAMQGARSARKLFNYDLEKILTEKADLLREQEKFVIGNGNLKGFEEHKKKKDKKRKWFKILSR